MAPASSSSSSGSTVVVVETLFKQGGPFSYEAGTARHSTVQCSTG